MKQYLITLCFLAVSGLATGVGGVFGQNKSKIDTPTVADFGDDLVHFGDVIDVDVVGGFEFDWRGTLTPDGFLDRMEGVTDPVYALCRSESEIAAEIAKILGRTLRDPKPESGWSTSRHILALASARHGSG